MTLQYLIETLGYKPLYKPQGDIEIKDAYTSDLLSDVMGKAPEESVLITVQGHRNTVAVASLAGIRAIVLCSRRGAPDEMLDAAAQEQIAVLSTPDNQFTASWKIARGLELV